MRGKLIHRVRRRRLSDVIDRLATAIDREFADVDAEFVLVVRHQGMVGVMSSLDDPSSIRALLAEGVDGNDGWRLR